MSLATDLGMVADAETDVRLASGEFWRVRLVKVGRVVNYGATRVRYASFERIS